MSDVSSAPTATASVPIDSGLKSKVLLVDDQPARLLTYESILEGVGVTCVRALSGEEALGRLLKQSFALIILDVSMPGMDGFETARMIRERPSLERTPIIFVTGVHVSALDALRGYEVGAIDYISVPIVPEILRSKVALLVELYLRRTELQTLNQALQAARTQLETERNAERLDSEARYRSIFENPLAFTIVVRALRDQAGAVVDLECVDANLESLRVLNRAKAELIGKRMTVSLPDQAAHLMPLCSLVLADAQPRRYEMMVGECTFAMCLFPMSKDTLVASGFDVTTRVNAEHETQRISDNDRAQRNWLAALLDSMNEEVYFTDTEHRYTYANPAAMREFGHERIAGISVGELVSQLEILKADGTPRPLEDSPPLRALKGEIIRNEEHHVRTPRTGELRTRQVSSAPVRAPDGTIMGAVSVVRDVTDQRRIDSALQMRAAELREADRKKDEFIAMLAHELRNPLVPIRTAVELLKDARDEPSIVPTVRPMMERQVKHMVRLIDDLLDVSRITSGKVELRKESVSLSGLVGGAVEANRDAISAANLKVSVRMAEPHLVVNVDPTRFSQILSNIIHNATKFTPADGRIQIACAVQESDSEHPQLRICICDTGVGIAPEMLPRIFELFSQAGTAGHRRHEGLGIGLALAKKFAEMHGGTLEARSDGADRGSAFVLTVPLPDHASQPGLNPALVRNEPLLGTRVAIIDDNRDAADIMALLLESQGAEVRTAYDGESGISAVRELKATAVLLDIGMPDMDGFETCRRLRAEFGADLGIIAMTGWGNDLDKTRTLKSGFDRHLTKPADPEQLAEAVRALAKKDA